MNLRQSKEFADFMKLSGWTVERIDSNYVYLRKISFLPPLILKISYPQEPINFGKIENLIKKYRPLFVQIQPQKISSEFRKYHYQPSRSFGHVTKTIHLDLSFPEKKILAQMKKDVRYEIRKAGKENIKIQKTDDLKKFRQAWKKSVNWQRDVPSLKTLLALNKAFGKKVFFLVVQDQAKNTSESPKLIAGTVILLADKTAYYYYAFTSKEGRKKFAQYLLVWEAIKMAKKLGCRIFDFEGIYDERFPIKSWLGFSHFKKSFGGKEVEYPGCLVKHHFPF